MSGNNNWQTDVTGTTPEYVAARDGRPARPQIHAERSHGSEGAADRQDGGEATSHQTLLGGVEGTASFSAIGVLMKKVTRQAAETDDHRRLFPPSSRGCWGVTS